MAGRNIWRRRLRNILIAALMAALPTMRAHADASPAPDAGSVVLAVSAVHKLRVLALGAPSWCRPALSLRLEFDPGSPDAGNPDAAASLLDRLRSTIAARCPAATSAVASVAVATAPAPPLVASASGSWTFAPAPAPAPAPEAATAEPFFPRELGYASALLAYVGAAPTTRTDDATLRWWAASRFPQDFNRVRNDEFALQSLLATARADLAQTLARRSPGSITIPLGVQFGSYDFTTGRFPIAIGGNQITVNRPCCTGGPPPPAAFTLRTDDLTLLDGLPMPAAEAEAFLRTRSRGGWVDRRLTLFLTFAVTPAGFDAGNPGYPQASVQLVDVVFMPPENGPPLPADAIAHWTGPRIAALREARVQAAAAQATAARRATLLATRAQSLAMLRNAPLPIRLANAVSPDPAVGWTTLASERQARATALLNGAPAAVSMLVQAGSGGEGRVDAAWPGFLALDAPPGGARWTSGRWYVVRGTLAVPTAGTDDVSAPATAVLTASAMLPCDAAHCTDQADPDHIVDAKLAAAGATP